MSISWRHLIRVLVGTLLLAGLGMTAQAQTGSIPATIAYTGFLRDNLGDPVNGNVNLTFELFDAATGGSALWTETQNSVAVAGGVFSVQLGSDTTFESQGLTFDKPLFLAISVNGELLNARLPMSSAPYALRSGEGISNVFVSCPTDSIQDAIDNAPAGGPLIVTIEGICEENVNLERDRVTFLSATDTAPDVKGGTVPTDGIRGLVDNSAAIRVDGASDIVVRGLVLESAPGGTLRRGIWIFDNGSVALFNVLSRDSYAGAHALNGGFVQTFDSLFKGNTSYGLVFADGGHGRIEDTDVTHNVSVTSAGAEGAVAAFRSNNVRFRGTNQIINAGDDGLFDANDPDALVNDDNGRVIYISHGVQVRQDRSSTSPGGPSRFVGDVSAGNQVQVSLRDAELIGNISLSGNSLMDMRTNSADGQEVSARSIEVGNHSRLSFGRDDIDLRVSGRVRASNHSILGIFKDSITSEFGSVQVNNFSEVQVRGTTTIAGEVSVSNNSDFNSWNQLNVVSMGNLNLSHQSRANLRGQIEIDGFLNAFSNSSVDLNDEDRESTTNKTVVNVAGKMQINEGSRLNINNTAVMNVAGDAAFHHRGSVNVDGFFEDPPDCDVCTVDNASELIVSGANGLQLSQYGALSIGDGGVVRAKSMGVGPFATISLGGGSDLEIQDGGSPGPIDMFNFNQVFWGGGSVVIGNITIGTFSNINVDGGGNELQGGIVVNPGVSPGIFSVFGAVDLTAGNVDCQGQTLNTGTVNVSGGTVTFSGGGDFVNCPVP